MERNYPTLADIETVLLGRLANDFATVPPRENERLRYLKIGNKYNFQVGIEEQDQDEEEPGFNHIYLIMEFDRPEGMDKSYQRDFIPTSDTMDHVLGQKTGIYHHGPCDIMPAEEDIGKKICAAYHIGFEKGKVTPKLMTGVLFTLIKYFSDYIEVQLDALSATFES